MDEDDLKDVPPAHVAWTLDHLFANGPMDEAALAISMHSHPRHVERDVATLEAGGFIESVADANVALWRLTPRGRRAVAILKYDMEQSVAKFRREDTRRELERRGLLPRDPMIPDERPKRRRWWRS